MKTAIRLSPSAITRLILLVRGERVILDTDLAAVYQVPTKRLNEQFRRNRERFPQDFAFQLTRREWAGPKPKLSLGPGAHNLRSRIATSSSHGGRRYLPMAFTEHGALMVANILNRPGVRRRA